MTPTQAIRDETRLYIDDVESQLFTDVEIDQVLSQASCTYAAASRLWMLKAARLQSERGLLDSEQAGQERYERASLSSLIAFCREQSIHYAQLASMETGPGSGIVLSFNTPRLI